MDAYINFIDGNEHRLPHGRQNIRFCFVQAVHNRCHSSFLFFQHQVGRVFDQRGESVEKWCSDQHGIVFGELPKFRAAEYLLMRLFGLFDLCRWNFFQVRGIRLQTRYQNPLIFRVQFLDGQSPAKCLLTITIPKHNFPAFNKEADFENSFFWLFLNSCPKFRCQIIKILLEIWTLLYEFP